MLTCCRGRPTMMIDAMKTLGIVALLAAGLVLSLGLIGMCREDSPPPILRAPSVVERFQQSNPGHTETSRFPSSPLVEQAQRFASYLNPVKAAAQSTESSPADVSPVVGQTQRATAAGTKVTAAPGSAFSLQFVLQGISYYRADPGLSMALVYEPGSGRRWVRPGAQIGHFTIERIEADTVTCREGTRTQVVAVAPSEIPAKTPGMSEKASNPQPSPGPLQAAPAPPPVRGLRQMPLARVTAKLGVPPSPSEWPDAGLVEPQ
jgi:hypothetical protein